MKQHNSVWVVKSVLVTACFVCSVQVAQGDFVFGEPEPVVDLNSDSYDGSPCITADGLELYFASNRDHGADACYTDIWVATRTSTDEPWGTPRNLGEPVIRPYGEEVNPCISADGLELYFSDWFDACSVRPGGQGGGDIWVSKRETREADWGEPINLGLMVNSVGQYDGTPHLSSDGLELYFFSNRAPGNGGDFYVSTRPTKNDPWGPAVDLGAPINTMAQQDYLCYPFLSYDGLSLFFTAVPWPWSGGAVAMNGDIFVTTRSSRDDGWGVPSRLPVLSSARNDEALSFARGGSILYFARSDPYTPFVTVDPAVATSDIWQVEVTPIVDITGDGIVDSDDVRKLVDHWHTYDTVCDIAPAPLGDGFVDVQDLVVLAEHLFDVYPSAEPVDVNDADNGGQIELELGKLLVVTLASNPSTGYRWELAENNESILKQFGEVEFKSSDTGDPLIVGAGGWEIFRFKGLSAGQTALRLVYRRPWEEGVDPLKTFSLRVTVP